MEMPKRPEQHVVETESFRIFETSVPKTWIVREVSERDYGIDCYLELVTPGGDLTGDLVSVQLKGTKKINWALDGTASTSAIKRSTWSYWHRFPVPVFLFLVDCEAAEVYYESIRWYIRKYTDEVFTKEAAPCRVRRVSRLGRGNAIAPFVKRYFRDRERDKFEDAVVTLIANVAAYSDFVTSNMGRDSFMGVEMEREFYARHMNALLEFLYDYLGLDWDAPSIDDLKRKGQATFGKDYVLYEATLTELLQSLEPKMPAVLLELKKTITQDEMAYWAAANPQLINFFLNMDEKGNIPWMWRE